MKIAFIVDSFPTLSETFVLNQVTALIDLGHDARIFAGSPSRETLTHPDVDSYGLRQRTYCHNDKPSNRAHRMLKALWLVVLYGHRNPRAVWRSLNVLKYGGDALSLTLLYRVILFLRAGRFDIIYCQFGNNGVHGALLKELGISGKVVTMFHAYDIRLGVKKGAGIYRRLAEHGDCFLSISDYNYRHLLEFGIDPAKIVAHPVGIDIDRFSFRETVAPAGRSDPIRILTIARLHEVKGLCYGIRAIDKLANDYSIKNLRYEIIGDGPLRDDLQRLVEERHLSEIVTFSGARQQHDVIDSLARSHLFLLPSIAEATPVSLMEAQAVGLPVVATAVGSVDEVVLDGRSGFLVQPGDADALAERLKYLIEHPDVWPRMGWAGREFVSEHYDVRKLIVRFVKICEQLLVDDP